MKSKPLIYKVTLIISLAIISNCVIAQPHNHLKQKHHSHHHYKSLPHWGNSFNAVPRSAYLISRSGVRYHYNRGIFYKPMGTKYVIARAPLGARIGALPKGHIYFVLNGRTFYYYYGTFYVRSGYDDQYVTVAPPVGAQVDELPDGYKKVFIDNNLYYEFEGVYYKAFINEYGEVWYEVVG